VGPATTEIEKEGENTTAQNKKSSFWVLITRALLGGLPAGAAF
jgi:hypothetical protein